MHSECNYFSATSTIAHVTYVSEGKATLGRVSSGPDLSAKLYTNEWQSVDKPSNNGRRSLPCTSTGTVGRPKTYYLQAS